MTPQDQALLQKLTSLLYALPRADEQGRVARESAAKLKASAKRGDVVAKKAWNTLSALYWRFNSPTWKKAEAYYARLLKNDPKALASFGALQERAKTPGPQGDLAKKALSTLKSVHNHRKESVWYPGAPRIAGYPMPQRHRPGIVIGGYLPDARCPRTGGSCTGACGPVVGGCAGAGRPCPCTGRACTGVCAKTGQACAGGCASVGSSASLPGMPPWADPAGMQIPGNLGQYVPPGLGQYIPPGILPTPGGGAPAIPGLPPGFDPSQFIPPGGIPGLPGGLGSLGQYVPPGLGQYVPPGLGQYVPPGLIPGLGGPPSIPGIDPNSPEGRALGNYLPLTVQAATSLLSMIAQARQSPGRSLPGQGPDFFMTTTSQEPGGAPSSRSFTSPKGFTTVSTPSGMTTVSTTAAPLAPSVAFARIQPVKALGLAAAHLSQAEQEAIRADEVKLLSMANAAAARGSPAAGSLMKQYQVLHAQNVAKGLVLT